MIGTGTIVNVIAIMMGSSLGVILKHKFKDQYKDILISAVGLATLVLGLSGALSGIFKIEDGRISEQYILEIILFLVIGSILGVLLRISEKLDRFGNFIQNRFNQKNGTFSKGFVTASLIFCVGAMAIMGSIQDGMSNDYTVLFSKSILDFITSIVLASALGIGVLFSIIPVAIYQLIITFSANIFGNFLPEETKVMMNIIGSILIIGISFNLLDIKRIKVADMLPAIFLPIMYYCIKYIFTIASEFINQFIF